MKSNKNKILVVGGTGGVGGAVLHQLVAKGISVRASSRTPEKIPASKGVESVALDFTKPETIKSALAGIKKVFLYAHSESVDGFVKEAKAAGVERIVVLSSSSTTMKGAENDFIGKRHLITERAVENSRLAWTFLRPGAFATNTLRWAPSIRAAGKVQLPYPESQSAPIHEEDIAAVAVVALTTDALLGAKPVLTGPESLTQQQEVEIISTVIGKPINVEKLTPDQARESMVKFMPPQFVEAMLSLLAKADGVPAQVSDEVQKITGKKARTYAEWVQSHKASF